MSKQRLWVDTDTASDDAVALVMALRDPNTEVDGISVVAGNVGLNQCVQNALYTVELCGKDTPVYVGQTKPLMQELQEAREVHGEDGMGDIGLDLKGREPAEGNAIDVMTDYFLADPGERALVTLGPLTNVAVALMREPRLADAVKHCYVMGGAPQMPGNVTAVAEFNIFVDPEAAQIVFESGMEITMVGWDVSMAAGFVTPEFGEEIRAIGTPFSSFAMDIQGKVQEFITNVMHIEGFDLPDPLAMAVALDPSIAEVKKYFVEVVTGTGITRGQTVVDYVGITGKPQNVWVTTHIPPEKFQTMLKKLLS